MSFHAIRFAVLAALICTAGCKRTAEHQSKAKGAQGKSATTVESTSVRAGTYVLRSLITEASRSEHWERGLFISLGTPDQHKYTRGGWRSGWGDGVLNSKKKLVVSVQRSATLRFTDWTGRIKSVVARIRSLTRKQKLTLYVDGKAVSTRPVHEKWSRVAFQLPARLKRGRHVLDLSFSRDNKDGNASQLDWIWLRTRGKDPPSPIKVATRTFGSPRRSLVGDPERCYSFHLQVPPRSTLVFDYAGEPGTRFEVRAASDGDEPKRLFSEEFQGERWREARVDLTPLAGRAVRLDLITRGKGGAAGWGEPDIVTSGEAPRVPLVRRSQRAKNLIYILIDTARQDVYTPFNPDTRVKAPALAKLAEESTVFTNAYTNSNWTKPSIASIWSSLYPITHDTKSKKAVLPKDVPVLSEHLQDQGFATAAFIANGYTSDKFGFKRGWRTYRNYIRENRPPEAEHVYADALAWLKKSNAKRFFLWIQTIDPHVPYGVPSRYRELYFQGKYEGQLGPSVTGYETQDFNEGTKSFTEDDKRYVRALYDAEITYHDDHLGKFLEQLRTLGALEETLVVVSNDHGEEMLDHGRYGHGHTLYEELIRSPLLIRYPAIFPEGKRVDQVVEAVDLVPTILEVLGAAPMKEVEGQTLLGAMAGRPSLVPGYAVAEYLSKGRAVRVGRFKLIQWRRGNAELYDLRVDSAEEKNLASTHPIARRACEVYLGEGLANQSKNRRLIWARRKRRFKAGRVTMDAKLRRQLMALGYIN